MLNKLQLKRKEAAQDVIGPDAEVAEARQSRSAPAEEQAASLITDLRSGRPLPPSCQEQLASLAGLLLGGQTAASQPPRPLPTPSLPAAQQARAPADQDSTTFLQLAGLCPAHPASQPTQWGPATPFPGFCNTVSNNTAAAAARLADAAGSHGRHTLAQAFQQQAPAGEGHCVEQHHQLAAYPELPSTERQQQQPGDAQVPCAAPAQAQQPGEAAKQQVLMPYQLTSGVQEVASGGDAFGSVMAADRQRQSQIIRGHQQQVAHGKITALSLQQQHTLKDVQQAQHLGAQQQPDGLDRQAQQGQQSAGEGNAGTACAIGLPAAVKECPICGRPFAAADSVVAVQSHIEACLNGEAAELFYDDEF